jgi:hypothetical protein
MFIENYIDYYASDELERDLMKGVARVYVKETEVEADVSIIENIIHNEKPITMKQEVTSRETITYEHFLLHSILCDRYPYYSNLLLDEQFEELKDLYNIFKDGDDNNPHVPLFECLDSFTTKVIKGEVNKIQISNELQIEMKKHGWYNIFKETKILNLYNQDYDRAGDYSDICDVLGADKNLDSISVLCIGFRQEKSR